MPPEAATRPPNAVSPHAVTTLAGGEQPAATRPARAAHRSRRAQYPHGLDPHRLWRAETIRVLDVL
jgi:hypothetical protein